MFEQKDGNFVCFQKQSKKGGLYYSGTVKIDGKEYYLSLFEKTTQKGSKYISGVMNEKQKDIKNQDNQDNFIDDDIPF